jgi:pSer/pThr/pTyr-binding forkhead associated (FHA) protein|nr:FHA domain-containing protein [Kofleriaceae bacterium]
MDVGLVCDACSALTPIGVPQCKRCGLPVALDPRRAKASSPPPPRLVTDAPSGPMQATTACPKCGEAVGPNNRFCPACGGRVPPPSAFIDVSTQVGPRPSAAQPVVGGNGAGNGAALGGAALGGAALGVPVPTPIAGSGKVGRSTLFFGGAVQAARAKLTLIRGDGDDGVSFTLAGQDHFAGRGDCPIAFPDDPFLSPTHANFRYANGTLVVRDEGSLNGVYVRITGKADIQPGATVLVGEQVLRVNLAPTIEDAPDSDGTYYSASMPRPARLEVRQSLRGGPTGWVYRVGETATLGREGNDINFPDDPFISGRHAELKLDNGQLAVIDLGSRNGTFIRVSGEKVLRHGDYVFLGQQLLRVEIV